MEGIERYKQWLKREGDNFTTRTKAVMKDFFLIHDRRENAGIELPPDVVEGRRWNDSLHKIERSLERVEKNTEDVPWLAKFVANASKFLGGQAELKYPSKKK